MTLSASRQKAKRPWPAGFLLDLDGTLIDSAADIAAAANHGLQQHGLPSLPQAKMRQMIGKGMRNLVTTAIEAGGGKADAAMVESVYKAARAAALEVVVADARIYDGVIAFLASARQHGCRLGVVTNKPQPLTDLIIEHFHPQLTMDIVIGASDALPLKPAPDMLHKAMESLSITAEDTVMVGDSINDIAAAEAAGVFSVVIRGGYSAIPVEAMAAGMIADDFFQLGNCFA